MRALFHPMTRDARGRLGVGLDLDYGPGRDPMSIHIDVPREFEAHAKQMLKTWAGSLHKYIGMAGGAAMSLPQATMKPRLGIPMTGRFGGYFGASLAPTRPRQVGAQAARAFRAARTGRGAGMLANIAQGLARGDSRAAEAASKLEDAAKASRIAMAIASGNPQAKAFRASLESEPSAEAQEAAGMIDACLQNQKASCNCAEPTTAEQDIADMVTSQWDTDPADVADLYSDFDLEATFVKNAGTELADEMLVEYSGFHDNMARDAMKAARYDSLRRRVLSQAW